MGVKPGCKCRRLIHGWQYRREIAAGRRPVGDAEERAAAGQNGRAELILEKALDTPLGAAGDIRVGHANGHPAFLRQRTRPGGGGVVHRVDGVDAAADQLRYSPGHLLTTEAQLGLRAGCTAELAVHIDIGETGMAEAGSGVEAAVGQRRIALETVGIVSVGAIATGKLEVVPEQSAHEDADILLADVRIDHALEHRRYRSVLAEIEIAATAIGAQVARRQPHARGRQGTSIVGRRTLRAHGGAKRNGSGNVNRDGVTWRGLRCRSAGGVTNEHGGGQEGTAEATQGDRGNFVAHAPYVSCYWRVGADP